MTNVMSVETIGTSTITSTPTPNEAIYSCVGSIDPLAEYYYHPRGLCDLIITLRKQRFHVPTYPCYMQSGLIRTMLGLCTDANQEIVLPDDIRWTNNEFARFLCMILPGYNGNFPFLETQLGTLKYVYPRRQMHLADFEDGGSNNETISIASEELAMITFKHDSRIVKRDCRDSSPDIDWTSLEICNFFECKHLLLGARSSILSISTNRLDTGYLTYMISCAVEVVKRDLTAAFSPNLFLKMIFHHDYGIGAFSEANKEQIKRANLYNALVDAQWNRSGNPTITSLLGFVGIFKDSDDQESMEEEDDDNGIEDDDDDDE